MEPMSIDQLIDEENVSDTQSGKVEGHVLARQKLRRYILLTTMLILVLTPPLVVLGQLGHFSTAENDVEKTTEPKPTNVTPATNATRPTSGVPPSTPSPTTTPTTTPTQTTSQMTSSTTSEVTIRETTTVRPAFECGRIWKWSKVGAFTKRYAKMVFVFRAPPAPKYQCLKIVDGQRVTLGIERGEMQTWLVDSNALPRLCIATENEGSPLPYVRQPTFFGDTARCDGDTLHMPPLDIATKETILSIWASSDQLNDVAYDVYEDNTGCGAIFKKNRSLDDTIGGSSSVPIFVFDPIEGVTNCEAEAVRVNLILG